MKSKPFPNTFIVGAAKAGTTSLYAYLSQHPQVYMSPIKEPHFFSRVRSSKAQRHIIHSVLDPLQYEGLFTDARDCKIIGEASPSYLCDENAARRIKSCVPDARIIILLRDPIERVYSHYLMDVRNGIQQKNFYEALIDDYSSKKKGWGVSHMYVELGLYAGQIEKYMDIFAKSQVSILMFEDLKNQPRQLLNKSAVFLGINPKPFQGIDIQKKHNPYYAPKSPVIKMATGISTLRRIAKKKLPGALKEMIRGVFFDTNIPKPPMENEAIRFLHEIYDKDISSLEDKLQTKLPLLRKIKK